MIKNKINNPEGFSQYAKTTPDHSIFCIILGDNTYDKYPTIFENINDLSLRANP